MSDIEYRRGQDEDMQEIIDLADLVFSKYEEPHDFQKMLPKLYGSHVQTQDMHFLARENGKLTALVCLMPGTLSVFGETFKYCSIGTVCVHESSRGKGHMKVLMDMALQEMERQGCTLSVLGGRRQRYEYFGFYPAGVRPEFYTEMHNLDHYLRDRDPYDIKLVEVKRDDSAELEKAHQMYQRQKYYCEYSEDAFYDRLCSWYNVPYNIYDGDSYLGYCDMNTSEGSIEEMLLSDDAYIPYSYLAIMKQFQLDHIRSSMPLWQQEAVGETERFCEEYRLQWDNRYRIMNYTETIRIFMKLKASCQKMISGRFVLDIDSKERICMEVKGDKIEVYETKAPMDVRLEEREVVALLFSPDSLQIAKNKREQIPEFVWQWLPLPLGVPELDLC